MCNYCCDCIHFKDGKCKDFQQEMDLYNSHVPGGARVWNMNIQAMASYCKKYKEEDN